MSFIERDLNNIKKQFISVDELLSLLSDIGNTTIEKSARWLVNNIQFLKRTKKLVSINSYTIVEYENNNNDFYNCPITAIELIAGGEDCGLYADCIGFARKRVLVDLKSYGVNIDDELIKNSLPYISKNYLEGDDNFYKNQCIDLIKEAVKNPENELSKTQKNDIPYVHFLDKSSLCYVERFALILRINQDMNYTERYADEKVKINRIKMFLEDYGSDYGYSATDTHAKNLAQVIPNRKDAQIEAKQTLAEILFQK